MKHVEFYSKNKFEKLVHLVGFIIRINHDTRSSESQSMCFVMSVFRPSIHSSICLHVLARLPLDGLPRNLMLRTFMKIQIWLKSNKHIGHFTCDPGSFRCCWR